MLRRGKHRITRKNGAKLKLPESTIDFGHKLDTQRLNDILEVGSEAEHGDVRDGQEG